MTPLVRSELEKQLVYHANRINKHRQDIERAERMKAESIRLMDEHVILYKQCEQRLCQPSTKE
jgi:hypothetical protein